MRHVGQIERDRPDAGEPHFLDPDDASSTCTTVSTTSATDYASTSTTTTTSTRDGSRRPFPNLQDICPPVLEKCTTVQLQMPISWTFAGGVLFALFAILPRNI